MRCGGMEYGYNGNKKRRASKMGDHAAKKETDEIIKKSRKASDNYEKENLCGISNYNDVGIDRLSVNNKKSRWFYNNRIRTEPKVRRNYVEKRFTMVSYPTNDRRR